MDEHGFEARLRHLEYILAGQTNIPRNTKTSTTKRIDELKKELYTLYKTNKPIKEFMERCNIKEYRKQLGKHELKILMM